MTSAWTAERKYDAAVRAHLGRELLRPDSRLIERPGWKQLVTPSAVGYLNEVYWTQLGPDDIEHAIDEAIASYRAHRLPTKWYVGPNSEPADLGDRLLRRGFEASDLRAMGSETDRVLALPNGVEVVEVGEADLEGYLDTQLRGWSLPDDQRAIERQTHLEMLRKRPQTASLFVARIGGQDVGTAGIFVRDGFWIYP